MILQDLKKNIQIGWPDQKNRVLPGTGAYYNFRDELVVQNGIIFKGERVVVAIAMTGQILRKIHSSHVGTERCLRRTTEVMYWPGMNAEIKENVSACEICNSYRAEQPKEPLMSQTVPDRPWSKVAVHLLTLGRKDYLIMVDDYCNFFEFDILPQTTTLGIVTSMKSQFARHGIPDEVTSDNGPQFASTNFQNFAKE